MSRDPIEDGFNFGASLFSDMIKFLFMFLGFLIQFVLPLLIKLLPFALMFCFFVFSIHASILIAPFYGLIFGIRGYILGRQEIRVLRTRLARQGNGPLSWKWVSDSCSTIFKIASFCFQSLYEYLNNKVIERNVAPGDDMRPDLENGFIRLLPGPYWLKALSKICVQLILFFSVPGIWIGVLLLYVCQSFFGFLHSIVQGIAGAFRTKKVGER